MRKTVLLLLFSLFAISVYAQSRQNLVARNLYFKEKNRFNVTLSVDGNFIYYQKKSDGTDSSLYFVNKASTTGEFHRKFKGQILKWMPIYSEGLLLILKEGNDKAVYYTSPLSQSLNKINLKPFKTIEFLGQNKMVPNKVMIYIDGVKPSDSGYFIMDLFNGNMKFLGGIAGEYSDLFDENFFKVAQYVKDKSGRKIILRHSVNGWEKEAAITDSVAAPVSKPDAVLLSQSLDALYFLETNPNGMVTLSSVSLKTGVQKELVSDLPGDISEENFSISSEGKPIAVNFADKSLKRIMIDASFKELFEKLDKELTFPYTIVDAKNENKELLIQSLDAGLIKFYYFDKEKERLSYLFSDYSYLDKENLAFKKSHSVKSADGLDIPVLMYARKDLVNENGTAKLPMPTVIFLYGNPWDDVSRISWEQIRHLELLADRGYLALAVNIGEVARRRNEKGESIWNDKIASDVTEIANWGIKSGTALRRKIGLMGFGYGAYAANHTLLKSPDMFSLAVSINGIGDVKTFSTHLIAQDSTFSKLVGDITSEKASNYLTGISPTQQAGLYKSPLLITAGGLDKRVPREQSDLLAKALSNRGKELIYFVYPEEGQDFKDEDSWVSFWAITESFLNKNLGGNKAPRSADVELGDFQLIYGDEFVARIE